jgi:hypothetical protein
MKYQRMAAKIIGGGSGGGGGKRKRGVAAMAGENENISMAASVSAKMGDENVAKMKYESSRNRRDEMASMNQ